MKKIIFIMILLCLAVSLYAENFYIKNYDVRVDVSEDRVYRITESLDLFYTKKSHGFYRDIPIGYDTPLKVKIYDVKVNDEFSTEKTSEYYSLKIGDSDKYVEGLKHYEISYSYDLGQDDYSEYDEFYFNLIGLGWDCVIENASFVISFPKEIQRDKIYFTYGPYKSTNKLSFSLAGTTISSSINGLRPNEGVTLRVEMEEGYFVGARVFKDHSLISLIIVILLSAICIMVTYTLYKKYGVDKPLVIYPSFDPPEELSPLSVGYIYNGAHLPQNYSAMIFYLADKGYLSIEEVKKNSFILHKKKELIDAPEYEIDLFNALFYKSDSVKVKDLDSLKLGSVLQEKVQPKVTKRFSKGKFSLKSSRSSLFSGISTALVFLFAILAGVAISITDFEVAIFSIISLLIYTFVNVIFIAIISEKHQVKLGLKIFVIIFLAISAIVCVSIMMGINYVDKMSFIQTLLMIIIAVATIPCGLLCSCFTTKRSEYGQMIIERILGYRDFLEKVEVDKLKKLIETDPEYFYHNLSYAIVLGLEERWAKKFESLFIQPASWYIGGSATNYYYYALLYRRFNSNYTSKMLTSGIQSSSQGGARTFSGSTGFSGGGFGGGGGRSW